MVRAQRGGWASAPPGVGISARFDDLTAGGTAIRLTDPAGVLVATEPGEVVPALRAVEAATTAGRWAAGYIAYEAAGGLDPRWTSRAAGPTDPMPELPLVWFGLFSKARRTERLTPPAVNSGRYSVRPWRLELDEASYRERVEALRDQIGAGQTYQVNLTQRMRSAVSGDHGELYRDLALAQGGAYNAFLDTGRFVIASASPELFFDWSGDRLTARPMKGTARRGRWAAEDDLQAQRLRDSAKERAENAMIVDLLRNDLGRVAVAGTVAVPTLFALERYPTVWQLTSTVTAQARPEVGLVELLQALFPCGSVTGAPKQRSMGLIAELEPSRRGVYCGAVGLVAPPGSSVRAHFNVAIRTVVVDRDTGEAVYGSGGGITWDSRPGPEYAELLAKAAVLHAPPEEFQLLETMAYLVDEGWRHLDCHLERLARSATYFSFPFDRVEVIAALQAAVDGRREPGRVRLLLDRRGRPAVELGPLPYPAAGPLVLAIDHEPVDPSEPWLYHKTTRRGEYQRRATRHPGTDDVVLLNRRGELTETTIASLALRLGGRWWTPPQTAGCLAGIGRQVMLDEGRLQERTLTVADLAAADGIALISSLRGWREAVLAPGAFKDGIDPAGGE